jgi:cytosine deaminase
VEGLKRGVRAIGAAPNFDSDHPGQIRRVFELAREYDVEIDMHIDSGHDPAHLDTHFVADLTEQYRLGGRVAMGHATKIAGLPPPDQQQIARRLGDVGVAVTVLPTTDLFVLARDRDYNVPRCVADANLFATHGCNCSISTNNVLNPFTPFGDCSLIRMTNLHANVLQVSYRDELADLFAMITERSARLMNLKNYGGGVQARAADRAAAAGGIAAAEIGLVIPGRAKRRARNPENLGRKMDSRLAPEARPE